MSPKWGYIKEVLGEIYGEGVAEGLVKELQKLAASFPKKKGKSLKEKISEKDAALIIYANSIIDKTGKKKPLQVLEEFIEKFGLEKFFTVVHILPFYPWDTDRGFSVVDYHKVNPEYGDWSDIKRLSKKVRLMFDFVLNHASVQNPLVQKALIERHLQKDDPRYREYEPYKDFVIAYSEENKPSEEILKKLARPRPNPVLTPYVVYELKEGKLKAILGIEPLSEDREKVSKILGKGYVWTTFSRPKRPDGEEETRQVDLNYANPKVFLEAVKIILFYIQKGAKFLRLDATAYLWKELGTPSVHLRKTHLILRAIRAFLDMVAPDVVFIAEVNERQSKVFEYFGDERQVESDLVYQFTNFALALYSLLYQDGRLYASWYKSTKVAQGRQFITILGSHDGMGIKPLRDLLTTDEIESFAQRLVKEHGGLPNFAFLPGGRKIVYEVCSTPWNLINGEKWKGEEALRRYFLIVALGLMVKGLPAFYINGLFAAKNYFPEEGLDENRTVNRQIFEKQELFPKLEKGFHAKVLRKLLEILKIRANLAYFSPWEYFPEVSALKGGKVLKFEFKRRGEPEFLAIYNLSGEKQEVGALGFKGVDVFSKKILEPSDKIFLQSFDLKWIKINGR